ncbi:MAG: hypothetical protein WCJ61_02050 [Paludibacter sp.]
MAELNFKGPFHINHLTSLKLKGKVGVYIWGFMFDFKEKEISDKPIIFQNNNLTGEIIPDLSSCNLDKDGNPIGVDCTINDWIFIPYYVGERDNLQTRIKDHYDVTNLTNKKNNSALKYTRMHLSYYKSFYLDFPKLINKSSNKLVDEFVTKNIKSIEYFNDMSILKKLYPNPNTLKNKLPNPPKNHNPIDQIELNGSELNDSLKEVIVKRNNFWFCYAVLDLKSMNKCSTLKGNNKKAFLSIPEAQTYYSMKGKTISRTMNFEDIPSNNSDLFEIQSEDTCENIFKHDGQNNKGNIVCRNDFKGYLNCTPYILRK